MMRRTLLAALVLLGCMNITGKTYDWKNTLRERISLSGYAIGGFENKSETKGSDQFKVNLIILMAEGQVTDRLSVYMMYEAYRGDVHEIWAKYQFCPEVKLKVGQFKNPFSIENSISPTDVEFTTFALATTHMIAGASQTMMAGKAGRDLGAMVSGELMKGFLSYDVAVMNGAGFSTADDNSQKDLVGRLTLSPLKGLKLSGSYLTGTGNLHVTPAEAGITGVKANGNFHRERYAGGLELKTSPVNLRSEYMAGKDGNTWSHGFYATTSFNNIIIDHLDAIASYDNLNLKAGTTHRYTGGLQYWFYPRCRLQLIYSHNRPAQTHSENTLSAILQVRF